MSPLTWTEYALARMADDLTAAAGAPVILPFNPLMSLRGNAHLYTDAGQAVEAAAWGDQIRQWRDEREAPGGNLFPYADQPTAGLRPTLAPQLSGLGGVRGYGQRMSSVGLPAVDKRNCTLVITGILGTDYARSPGNALLSLGDAVGGLSLFADLPGPALRMGLDAVYSSADHGDPALNAAFAPYQVAVVQSTAAGVQLRLNGVAGTLTAAAASQAFAQSYLLDWSIAGSGPFNAFVARHAIYGPALAPADLATLEALLLAEASLGSLYPLSYPLLAFWGNSLTVGIGHGPTTAAQSYPAVTMSSLTNPVGYLLGAVSSKTTAQMDAACAAGMDGHFRAGRTGAQVFLGWELANDIFLNVGTSAAIYGAYKAFFQARKNVGWLVIVFDCMNNGGFDAGMVAKQAAVNASLAADFSGGTASPHILLPSVGNTYGDLLIQPSAIPEFTDTTNATYFVDGTHLTPAGYAVLAGYAVTALSHLGVT